MRMPIERSLNEAVFPFVAKVCNGCAVLKPASEFHRKVRRGRETLAARCIECTRLEGRERQQRKSKEERATAKRRWVEKNRAAVLAQRREREYPKYRRLSEEQRLKREEARRVHEAEIAENRRERAHFEALKQIRYGYRFGYHSTAEVYRARYRNDLRFALKERLRASVRRAGKRYEWIRARFASAAKNHQASSLWGLLGYSQEELLEHIGRQFRDGMTWRAFQLGEVHIDHIVPCSAFDLNEMAEVRACYALTNLRPVWQHENQAKGAKRLFLI